MTNKRNCLKNHQHMFDEIDRTSSHIVKQCLRCKVKNWQARNNGITLNLNPEPLRTCT
ncbi:MAG: hypothetical protein V3S69_08015 [Dehalococcoidales bacterium]